ncbi:hypothetical protein D3C80_2098440 [compost metagenome]
MPDMMTSRRIFSFMLNSEADGIETSLPYTATPCTAAASGSSMFISSALRLTETAVTFSARRARLRVPGIGTVFAPNLLDCA